MMGRSLLTPLLFMSCLSYGMCAVEWLQTMDRLQVDESLPLGVRVYTLLATVVNGTSDGIIYGFNNKLGGDTSIDTLSTFFRINSTTGEVFTDKNTLDFEIQDNRNLKVNLIAKHRNDDNEYAYQTSTVIVDNVNDETPEFVNGSLTVDIQENSAVGLTGFRALTNIVVTDVDGLITGPLKDLDVMVQYCVIGGQIQECRDTFELVRTATPSTKSYTGDFIIKKSLDFETSSKIQVQLLATDGANPITTDVVVNVIDVQDVPPNWITLPALVNAFDGWDQFRLNVAILARDQDTGNRPIFYYFEPGQVVKGIPIENVFAIQQTNSTDEAFIVNIVPLDLENTTYFRNYQTKELRSEWPLRIIACEIIDTVLGTVGSTDLECTPVGLVEIQIDDVNDNSPVFNQDTYYYEIYEDTANGNILDKPPIEVFDGDTEIFNKFTSRLSQESAEFAVLQSKNPAITVKNSSLIDYDLGPRQYDLVLIAEDTNNPSLRDQANIQIVILDVNDNRPVFRDSAYEAQIFENAPVATLVKEVTATDIDSGFYGTAGIKYNLEGPASYLNLFTIEESTGVVRVAACPQGTPGVNPCLDYDILPRVYDLTVVATDFNGDARGMRSSVPLTVRLLDVNDNTPTVPDYQRSIFEDEVRFTPPLRVQGSDNDVNTQLRYSIKTQGPGTFWKIDAVSGEVTVDKPNGQGIKFQDGNSGQGGSRFELIVAVTDGTFETDSRVTITVIDINDNKPKFFPENYDEEIKETTPPGTSILTVTATDEDDKTTANGQLEYNIVSGNVGGKFRLAKETGTLYVSDGAVFDYDVLKIYNMTAVVNDKGTPQQTAQTTIIIRILDENNRNPYVKPLLQEFYVFDNAPLNFYVGAIKAFDPDVDAVLRFYFMDPKTASSDEGFVVDPTQYDFTNLFVVNPENGHILVNAPLDSQRTSIVSYGVQVQDITPAVPQIGRGTVIILIKPFNTQAPKFEPYPSPIIIDEEQPIGSVVVSLIATDNNGIREFVITEQPDNNFFSVSSNTGAVSVFSRIDYEREPFVNESYCIVQVTDSGDPTLSNSTRVRVVFRNINDNIPEFRDRITNKPVNVYMSTIDENSIDGTYIGTAYAFDKDRPDSNGFHDVRYSMNDDRFDVDPLTGEMFVRLRNNRTLDREQNRRILAQVIAKDCPNCPEEQRRQAAANVQVTLLDVNDNPPVFSSREYSVTIFETIGVETEILQLFSSDADISDNAISYYTKIPNVGDDINNFFDVRLQSGRIYVAKSLVRHVGVYRFYVQAQDLLGTGFKANATVTVTVKPSANSPPIWVIPPVDNMTIYVLEEQYNGMLIYDVSARDDDTGVNGIVDYSFIYNGEDTQTTPEFQINRVTGVISAEIVYDREKVNKYVILLKAKDRGETPLETTRFLTIVIKDVNDNRPRFLKDEEEFRISEDVPANTYVGQVTATDPDENPIVVYDIISGNEDGVFKLNRSTGVIQTNRVLDRESQSVYYLDILASNDEPDYTVITSRRRRAVDGSIITVKISVGDINDLAPTFLQDQYYGCVSTRAPYDKHILTIQAIDRDAVGSGVVRYMIKGSPVNRQGSPLFGIHEKFGVVTNKLLMRGYAGQTFEVIVNARDAEDVAQSESANTTALIFVNTPGNEVRLLITQNTGEVRLYQSQIQSIIERSNDLTHVCINDIQDHVVDSAGATSTLWSDVYATGIRRVEDADGTVSYKILSATEFSNIIHQEKYNRPSDFDLLYIKSIEERSSSDEIQLKDNAVLIILIIIAVLVFLVIIFCIVAFMCIRMAKQQKKTMLIHKTHETPAPVMVVHEPEPEPVLYDNRAYVPEEPVPVRIIQEERHVIENPPVHVQYAVVQKRSESSHPYEHVEYVHEDDQDAIVVELKDDELRQSAVYRAEDDDEYRIETEVIQERM